MKTILNTLAAAALGLGTIGTAEAQTGTPTICGPAGCYTTPSYPIGYSSAYGYTPSYTLPSYTLPSYSTPSYGTPICPTPSHHVPVYREDRWDDRFDSRWDGRRNDRWDDGFDHRLGDRYHDRFGHDRFNHDRFDDGRDRLDRFDSHRHLNVSNPGRLWR